MPRHAHVHHHARSQGARSSTRSCCATMSPTTATSTATPWTAHLAVRWIDVRTHTCHCTASICDVDRMDTEQLQHAACVVRHRAIRAGVSGSLGMCQLCSCEQNDVEFAWRCVDSRGCWPNATRWHQHVGCIRCVARLAQPWHPGAPLDHMVAETAMASLLHVHNHFALEEMCHTNVKPTDTVGTLKAITASSV